VSKTLQITPRYAGGSGLLKSYLYVNGVRAWTRSSPGPFKVAATRFRKGVSNYEVVGVFADGRSASWVGSFRRCNAKH
jgi:hypothetical protein